jgi:apocytochrome f
LLKKGDVVKNDQALNVDPNVGGFGQEESEIVLQNPIRIVRLSCILFLCIINTNYFLVLKKKQFEKVQAAELNF